MSIIIQWITEPFLTRCSYLIFLSCHKTELSSVNNILINKPNDISILNDNINDKSDNLTESEKDKLLSLRQKLKVYTIIKSDNEIYYGLWGFLDIRIGIIYWLNDTKPDDSYHVLRENWYLNLKNN